MFMILMHHFIVHNGYDVLKLPLGPERIFFQLVMQGGGKVGVVIFFSISAWFFLDKEQTIKSNLKRVWIMERELLFWSLILVAFYLVFDRTDLGMKLMVKSIAPLSMGLWWYATAYAIFLALLPFLSRGLKALGREYHLALAATVLTIWGLLSFIPGAQSLSDNVFGFIYVFILISAYKWYMKPFTTKQIWLLTGIGFGFFLLYTVASATLSLMGHDMGIFITGSWKLPVVMVGFGMFLLFDRVTFHSRAVNRIAQSAFSVYLITDYAASGLVQDNDKPGTNVTGASDLTPVAEQLEMMQKVLPDVKKVGLLYCTAESNSDVQIKAAKKELDKLGLDYTDFTVSSSNEIQSVVESAVGKVDALYSPTDNTIAAGASQVGQICKENKLPFVTGEEGMCMAGGLFTLSINYEDLGYAAGEMAVKILKGEAKPEDMPIKHLSSKDLVVVKNDEMAEALGIDLSALDE